MTRPNASRPNIVYIHSHDTGRYIQPYGHAVHTPKLQAFAESGVLFRQAFCAAPTCSPSRAALLTGSWPHQNGMIGLAHRGSRLRDYRQHLIHMLKPLGYHAALCGVQHIAPWKGGPLNTIGYDEVIEFDARLSQTDAAARWIAARPQDQPFFLSVGFGMTHRTGTTPQGVQWHNGEDSPTGDPRYTRPPATLPDTPQTRQDFADFAHAVNRLDACMGRVIDAIDQAGLADRTLVIVTTDHGIAFPHMKCNLTDHGLGVMLMMRHPSLPRGAVVDAMVSHVDVFPTVCEMLSVERPPWLVGHSLLPLIRGEVEQVREEVFGEVNYHAAYEPMRAVRTQRYKYIRRWPDPQKKRPGPVLPNCDPSVSKDLLLAHGWADRAPDAEQLFDLVFDPMETSNLVHGDRAPDALAEMRQRLERWMRDTNDPLLTGDVPPYADMVVNDPDSRDPDHRTRPARASVA